MMLPDDEHQSDLEIWSNFALIEKNRPMISLESLSQIKKKIKFIFLVLSA